MDVCKVDSNLSIYHLGYVLGPRINAGGRVGKSSHGANLLLNSNSRDVFKIAIELNEYNFSNEELETIRSNTLKVLELYFTTSKFEFNNLKKSSLKINYTPRHYVASHILHLKYKKAVFSNDSFAKIWEFIWDAQNGNLNEKVQQLIGVLRLSYGESFREVD